MKQPGRYVAALAALMTLTLLLAIQPLPASAATTLFRITPTSLNSGPVLVGSSAPQQTVTITNVSSSSVLMSGAGGGLLAPFGVAQDCQDNTLQPGGSCHLFFGFNPTATGSASATSSPTWNGQAVNVHVSGTGVMPTFRITGTVLSFGPVQTGTSAPQQTVTITNLSPQPVTISGAGVDGPIVRPRVGEVGVEPTRHRLERLCYGRGVRGRNR